MAVLNRKNDRKHLSQMVVSWKSGPKKPRLNSGLAGFYVQEIGRNHVSDSCFDM